MRIGPSGHPTAALTMAVCAGNRCARDSRGVAIARQEGAYSWPRKAGSTMARDRQWKDVTRAVTDSCKVYPPVPGIECRDFLLSSEGLTPAQRQKALAELQAYQGQQKKYFLGYQANQALDFEADLKQYLDYHIN